MLRRVKQFVFGSGKHPRLIRFGLLRGITMNLDPSYQGQLILGLGERELQPWIARMAQGVATAVDAGTSEGSYFLWFLLSSDAKYVLGFEPEATVLSDLRVNIQLNEVGADKTYDVIPSFLGATRSANQVTLDDFKDKITFPAIVKIDVEGAESDVLRGASCLFLNDARFVIEVHSPEQDAQCREILDRANFRVEAVGSAWWRRLLPELRPGTHHLKTKWLVAWKE